jgi:hypothetical protein
MDLEHLTKHQIVLLTLLVSFVTSIATGIVTVSLVNQAPPQVERTVNQIVERTVQTVTQPATPVAAISTAGTEKTVVVNSDDVASQSIAAVQKAVVRIVTAKDPDTLVARGIIVAADGTALTDRGALDLTGATSYQAILADGETVGLTIPKTQATSTGTLVVDIAVGTSTGFAPASIANPSKLALGESIITIGGTGADTVSEGVIASIPPASDTAHAGLIEASVSSATPGSVLIDLFGDVVGLTTGDSAVAGSDFYTIATAPSSAPAAPAPKPSSS